MTLVKFLWREQRTQFALTTLLFLLHTILNVLILGIIGRYTSQMRTPPGTWWEFLLIVVCTVGAQGGAVLLIDKMAHDMSGVLRTRLLARVFSAPLATLERIGMSRVQTTFVDDIQQVCGSLPSAIGMARDSGFAAGIFCYLAWLSPRLMLAVLLMLGIGITSFYLLRARGMYYAARYRAATDRIFASFGNALAGLKQLKTSEILESAVADSTRAHCNQAQEYGKTMGLYFNAGVQVCVLLYFVMLLTLTYARLDLSVGPDIVAVYVIALMLVLSPLLSAAFSIEQASVASLSLGRIDMLLAELDAERTDDTGTGACLDRPRIGGEVTAPPTHLQSLELRGVCHTYRSADRQEFTLGPVNVNIRSGECLFVVGGNGTGKTTLVKLLTGLYTPLSGEIRVNDVVIDTARRPWLRKQFSNVFSDLCLFESLAGSAYDLDMTRRGAGLVDELLLDKALQKDSTLLAQAASCSSGERKRIAMLMARVEDRAMYVFDEFAADQDPVCKDLFYGRILEDLKCRGKIVIVVTHDERYFDRADHVLILERGFTPRLIRNRIGSAGRSASAHTAAEVRLEGI